MKTPEEKAKAYDNALGWMREVYPTLTGATKEDAEHYFPELRESEDEQTRQSLVFLVRWAKTFSESGVTPEIEERMLAYLEKQKELLTPEEKMKHPLYVEGFEAGKQVGTQYEAVFGRRKEQKPTDDKAFEEWLDNWYQDAKDAEGRIIMTKWEFKNFCRGIKNMYEFKSAEWSEKDKETIRILIGILKVNHPDGKFKTTEAGATDVKYISTDEVISRLESLSPGWKPTQEQMKALKNSAYGFYQNGDGPSLRELYEQLKKL